MRRVFYMLLMLSVFIILLGGCSKSSSQKTIQKKGATQKKETKKSKEKEEIKLTEAAEDTKKLKSTEQVKETKEKEENKGEPTTETKKVEKKEVSTIKTKTNYKTLNNKLNIYLESIGVLDVPFEEEIFNSDGRKYTKKELTDLSKEVLSVFRNEIYARHGYVFNDQGLNEFFKQYTWYKVGDFDKFKLNIYEKENLDKAIEVEKELGYR